MNKVYLMADIHGDWRPIRNFLTRIKYQYDNCDTIILLGDTGSNYFFNERDNEFKEKLNKFNINLFVIRGNHEERPSICMQKDRDSWEVEEYFGGWVYVEKQYPYIKYAIDEVAIYNIPYGTDYLTPNNTADDDIEVQLTYKTLVIPGAYSVDKYKRLQMGWSWFPQEQLTTHEMHMGIQFLYRHNWKVDLVLSHTCPIIYEPTDLFLSAVDQSMVDKSMERYLGRIEYELDYKAWCFGHYHQFRDYPRIDGKFRTMLFNDCAIELTDYMNGEVKKI